MIINLTQHAASPEQRDAGVIDMPDRALISELLTFGEIPSRQAMINRAETLASLVDRPIGTSVMIGGAPFFMHFLVQALLKRQYFPIYAFSKRMVVEDQGIKTSKFVHEGFIPAE